MREEILRLEGVSCWEQGVAQLKDVSLQIFAGEVMGLLAVDSHGLNTLIRVLRQNLPIQKGYVYYKERQINAWKGHGHDLPRIGIIERRSSLLSGLTVADNVFVLRPGFKSWIIRPALLREQLLPVLRELDSDISPYDYVEKLSAFQRFVVELVKAVLGGCKLVVLREVSTFISDADLSRLHAIIQKLARRGIAFLYIGYHFEELRAICDRTALLMHGTIPKVLLRGESLQSCGAPFSRLVREQKAGQAVRPTDRQPVFRAEHLTGGEVTDLSFSVAPGECLVMQDLNNRIFEDLRSILTGERPIEGGACWLDGERFKPAYTRDIAILLGHPDSSMLMPELTVLDNLCFSVDHRLPEIWRSARVRRGIGRECAKILPEELFYRSPDQLTVGEKYDLVYTRVRLQHPKVVFCIQPFQGADMELRMRIWNHLEALLEQGCALVILAVNLADSLSLADSLIQIRRSAPNRLYSKREFSRLPMDAPWLDLYR